MSYKCQTVSVSLQHDRIPPAARSVLRGAARDDTIDRRPWQIIAYNVEGIQKFQSSVAAWFRL